MFAGVAAVVAGAAAWRAVAAHNAQPWFADVPSRSALLGTWRAEGDGGGQVEFAADGRFSAAGLPVGTSSGTGLTGTGRWSLDARGRSVTLRPDHPPPDPAPDPGLTVVRAAGHLRLCVPSDSPGVLCDVLLRPAEPPR
ncbi:hypothetical protein HCJ76_03490 [Streptomyces sp. MC1]|uniref:hypothetical protein n=1 Tax=unclassified Streptomyces TaxID=2593676 RepID=UPI0004C840E5|nr:MULTISPECIES: hypothetical protein [unclassified Streptomyces]MBG7697187.1 hypothetical protein [Streptomyces sp. MC1]